MIKAFSGTAAGTGTGLTRGAARLSAAHSRKGPLGSGPLPPVSLALAPSVGRSMDPCRAIISLEEQEADGSGRLPMDPIDRRQLSRIMAGRKKELGVAVRSRRTNEVRVGLGG